MTKEPRLSELITGAIQDIQALIRGEIELVKAEVSQSAKRGMTGAGLFGLAVFIALFALLMLAFAAAYGLVEAGLDPWAAFLIIGVLMLLITALLVLLGTLQVKKVRGPTMAQEEFAKTKQAFAERAASAGAAGSQGPSVATGAEDDMEESQTVFPAYGGVPPGA